jgi:hypothetical protein
MITTAVGVLLVLVVLFGVFLFFARRILRLALKLAFVGAIVFSLFGGTAIGWWRGWFSPSSKADHATVQSNQRANSNRRR